MRKENCDFEGFGDEVAHQIEYLNDELPDMPGLDESETASDYPPTFAQSVEEELSKHPKVMGACVVMCSNARSGATTHAFGVLREYSRPVVQNFRAWCQRDLRDVLDGFQVHVLARAGRNGFNALAEHRGNGRVYSRSA
jgi:hypothetical protein